MLPIAPTTSHGPHVTVALPADEWAEVLDYLTIATGELRHLAGGPARTQDLSARLTTYANRCEQLRNKIGRGVR